MPKEKKCEKCGGKFLTVEFRLRSTNADGLDSHCRTCRKEVNAREKLKYDFTQRNLKPRTGYSVNDMDRSKRAGFSNYMARNPHYFRHTFRMEPTPENIYAAFRAIQKMSLHGLFKEGARLEVADGEISSVREY